MFAKSYGRTNFWGDTYVYYLDFSDICMPIMPVEDVNISNENNQALITPSQSYLFFPTCSLNFYSGDFVFPFAHRIHPRYSEHSSSWEQLLLFGEHFQLNWQPQYLACTTSHDAQEDSCCRYCN